MDSAVLVVPVPVLGHAGESEEETSVHAVFRGFGSWKMEEEVVVVVCTSAKARSPAAAVACSHGAAGAIQAREASRQIHYSPPRFES